MTPTALSTQPSRRALVALVVLCLLASGSLVSLSTKAADASTTATITGSGWGHGVGMSQYGARGMALQGSNSQQILQHYYTGTTISDYRNVAAGTFLVDDPQPLWVGIGQKQTTITFAATAGTLNLCQSGTTCPTAVANIGERWRFQTVSGGCAFAKQSGNSYTVMTAAGKCDASVTSPSGTAIQLPLFGGTYNGSLHMKPAPGGKLHAVVETSIIDYTAGIAEVPASWPRATLEAQAIAARTYALQRALSAGPESGFSENVKNRCHCHVFDDTRSQVFAGLGQPSKWVSAANETNTSVVTYNGSIIEAYYSSSMGLTTEKASIVFGGADLPYLQPADDSFAHLPAAGNTASSWTVTRDLSAATGLSAISDVSTVTRPSGMVESVTFTGPEGQVTLSGNKLRIRLSLRSAYFSISGDFTASAPPSGTYTVRAGDTLRAIAGRLGVSTSDLAAWNGISNPNLIRIGQVLKTSAPSSDTPAAPSAPAGDAGSPASTYTVKPGDTLGQIAARLNVTVSQLVQWNSITNPNLIGVGKVLRTVAGTDTGGGSTPAAPPTDSSSDTYTVKPGDTLGVIAARLQVSLASLVAANNIADPNLIRVGQVIRSQGSGSPAPAPSADGASSYTVRRGDTLGAIAARNNTTVSALMSKNSLSDPNFIRIGQVLTL